MDPNFSLPVYANHMVDVTMTPADLLVLLVLVSTFFVMALFALELYAAIHAPQLSYFQRPIAFWSTVLAHFSIPSLIVIVNGILGPFRAVCLLFKEYHTFM